MSSMSTSEENKYNPGILLTSCLLHSFIQGIIVSQAGRYYEDYYHLDTLSMKSYVGSIVTISLYVRHTQDSSLNLEAYTGKPKRADDVYQLQSLGDHSAPRRSKSNGSCFASAYSHFSHPVCRHC